MKLRWLALWLCGLVAACSNAASSAPAEGFNLLLITVDTTRADHLPPFGDPEVTPRLHALAERGWAFSSAYSQTNVTLPSHLTILSGLSALEHGVFGNQGTIPSEVETLAEAFQRAGYRTAGFPAAPHISARAGWRGFEELPNLADVADGDGVGRAARSWLRARAQEPFFAWVHFFDPHRLYEVPPELEQRFYPGDPTAGNATRIADLPALAGDGAGPVGMREWLGDVRDLAWPRAMYAAEVAFMDLEIGRLLDTLEKQGYAERTVVVVVADHGESLDEHDVYYAHKGLYEPTLRIPLLIAVPGLPSGTSDALVSTMDVAPTVAELFGLPMRGAGPGASLLPIVSGGSDGHLASRDTLVHQNAMNRAAAVRRGKWKLIWPIDKDHPIVGRDVELFDLERDPKETTNLAEAEPERVAELREFLLPYLELGPLQLDEASISDEDRRRLEELGYLDR